MAVASSTVRPPVHRRDIFLLFTTRSLRLVAYGGLAVVLALYLAEVGLPEAQIGLLLSLTLAGDWRSRSHFIPGPIALGGGGRWCSGLC